MEFKEYFGQVRERLIQTDTSRVEGKLAIMINLTGETSGTFYIEVKDGVLAIEPYEYNDRDVAITIKSEDFTKLLEKKADPVMLFTIGKIKVEGDIGKALELKRFL